MSVSIEPNVLEYNTPLTKSSTNYITIHNDTEEIKAFKVKTTAPKLYCVRPNAAILKPGETVKVSVIFLGLSVEPLDGKCKDKFLVIVLPAPYELEAGQTVSDIWNDLETEFKSQSIQKKIKVVYNLTPVEKSEEQTTEEQTKQEESKQEEVTNKDTGDLPNVSFAPTEKPQTKPIEDSLPEEKKPIEETQPKMEPPLVKSEQQELDSKISSSSLIFIAIIILALGWLYC